MKFEFVIGKNKRPRDKIESFVIEMLANRHDPLKSVLPANLAHVRIPVDNLIPAGLQFVAATKNHDIAFVTYCHDPIVFFFGECFENKVLIRSR